tara:strand:+ start:4497 stop:4958 length:462 start_codon:yes stop_codon:yes gene_type:complete
MKRFSLLITLILISFNPLKSQNNEKFYGNEFSVLELKDYSDNKDKFIADKDNLVKIEGEILSTCPMKGCWMKIKAEEDTILVRFKDYGFFVPTDGVVGDKTIINGKLSVDTLSVALLRHYAEDAGKPSEEINKIKDPEVSMTFLAEGVMIKEK